MKNNLAVLAAAEVRILWLGKIAAMVASWDLPQ